MAKLMRDIIEINEDLCNGCGQCITDCAEGALALVDGKAKIIADIYCDGLGNCLSGCPTGALRIIQKETEPFDEEAVKRLLAMQGKSLPSTPLPLPGQQDGWPLKLRLVRPDAPGLERNSLILASDCTAFASQSLHTKLAQGKRLIIACPKFEDKAELTRRLAAIFSELKPDEFTVARMEVPCCKALAAICIKAAELSGIELSVTEAVVDRLGNIAKSRWPLRVGGGTLIPLGHPLNAPFSGADFSGGLKPSR